MATRRKTQKARSRTTSRSSRGRRSVKAGTGGRAGGSRGTRRGRAGRGSTNSGGDAEADWPPAARSGEEAAGGSVASPDQDAVDELGRALGVEREADAELHTSREILIARDRRRWNLERRGAQGR